MYFTYCPGFLFVLTEADLERDALTSKSYTENNVCCVLLPMSSLTTFSILTGNTQSHWKGQFSFVPLLSLPRLSKVWTSFITSSSFPHLWRQGNSPKVFILFTCFTRIIMPVSTWFLFKYLAWLWIRYFFSSNLRKGCLVAGGESSQYLWALI